MKHPLSLIYSPDQLAHMLGKTKGTLAQWRHHKKGPAFCKLGGSVYYTKEAVEKYLNDSLGIGGGDNA